HSFSVGAPPAGFGGDPAVPRADPHCGRRVLPRSAGPRVRALLVAGDENKGAGDLGPSHKGVRAPLRRFARADRRTGKIARATLATGRKTGVPGSLDCVGRVKVAHPHDGSPGSKAWR